MLKTKLVENPNRKNMFTVVVEEDGKIEWSKKDGQIRQAIFDAVGLEYKQINILAAVVAEIVKANPELLSNTIIAGGVAKFAEIEALRTES